ncbi:tryptophan synthase subunit beta [Nocardia cyriacigeorgica]|uniref:Tryptophan synthase beta chain n=1 Tax=Nocardia cyriacigeorgica TaxID=135487 RepID=A0A4U8W873_9NOCA|nr:tryptophan synthase subunit beta [Nocardia cyriacigeorgica]MBF6096888.1 tryptophan synthase subunit beta [Nocardia cyriacigeorgica]MBF6158363.1 tryptophan synthase subunit beta [Nocardia cyriacigeorgica]MBF6197948.1 tryptophan synthase subunit beta [Nocardia cyriacigeorgica]MBF6316808.1 tryptophan synthase subunit beta [Nocardia cyriacigeorgica]MBF6513788.1 tryptophan synthase subunit beta [Nocardia cyriacigeorgica]
MVLDLGVQPAYRHGVYPDENGRFGAFGGRYVPEGLMPALLDLEQAYRLARADPAFDEQLTTLLRDRVGRPTRLHEAPRFAATLGVPGLKVYLKREDMAHTGSHKINNALGQALLAQRLGKTRIVAETGAGQHGGAVAAVCAMLGLECVVYMGGEDMRRQPATVARMRMLGADVRPVETGNRRVKEAISASVRDWVANLADTHLLLGTVVGPAPYPQMVRDFQTVIGREARADILWAEGRLPDLVLACVGGGSNALGLFHPFAGDPEVELVAVEAAGRGRADGDHAATLTAGSPGEIDGTFSYLLQDADGQIVHTHSIAAGLDYPGVGPELSYLRDSGRVSAQTATDAVALRGMRALSRTEGVLAGLESAHAVGHLIERAERGELTRNTLVVLCLSGNGDKDLGLASERLDP